MPLATEWSVTVNGVNATTRMNRYIESIEVSGKSGGSADSARLTFNDKGGRIALPPKSSPIEISLQGRLVFRGFTDAPECIISRGGGRTLEIACSSMKKTGKVKEGLRFHKDDCTLQEFMDEAAKKAGISSVKIDPSFGEIKRKFWSTRGRNFLALGQSLADELGGTFKIRGDRAVLAARGAGAVPGGGMTPTVIGRVGVNVIEARIRPHEGRPRWAKARVRYYDRKKAKWLSKDVEIGSVPGGSGPIDALGEARQDEDSAERAGKGRKTESEREGGSGSVTILLDVTAEAEGTFVLIGHRRGADGPYRIDSYRHTVTKADGGETALEIKQPKDEEGGSS